MVCQTCPASWVYDYRRKAIPRCECCGKPWPRTRADPGAAQPEKKGGFSRRWGSAATGGGAAKADGVLDERSVEQVGGDPAAPDDGAVWVSPIGDEYPDLKALCATELGHHSLQQGVAALLTTPAGMSMSGRDLMQLLQQRAAAKQLEAAKQPVGFFQAEKVYKAAWKTLQASSKTKDSCVEALAEAKKKVGLAEAAIVEADASKARAQLAYDKAHATYQTVLSEQAGRGDTGAAQGAAAGPAAGAADNDIEMDLDLEDDVPDGGGEALGLEGEELDAYRAKSAACRAARLEYKAFCVQKAAEVEARKAKVRELISEQTVFKRRRCAAELAARDHANLVAQPAGAAVVAEAVGAVGAAGSPPPPEAQPAAAAPAAASSSSSTAEAQRAAAADALAAPPPVSCSAASGSGTAPVVPFAAAPSPASEQQLLEEACDRLLQGAAAKAKQPARSAPYVAAKAKAKKSGS